MEKWTPGLIAFPGAQFAQASYWLPELLQIQAEYNKLYLLPAHLPGLFYCTELHLPGLHLSKMHLHQEGAHQTNSTETEMGRQSQQGTPKRISIPSAVKADSTGGRDRDMRLLKPGPEYPILWGSTL